MSNIGILTAGPFLGMGIPELALCTIIIVVVVVVAVVVVRKLMKANQGSVSAEAGAADTQQAETFPPLSGGAKAGYFCLGLFLNAIGILIAWLINKDTPAKSEAVKMSVIGFVISLVLSCVCILSIFGLALATSGGF
jgi:uncharacterized Tic20 family protein